MRGFPTSLLRSSPVCVVAVSASGKSLRGRPRATGVLKAHLPLAWCGQSFMQPVPRSFLIALSMASQVEGLGFAVPLPQPSN